MYRVHWVTCMLCHVPPDFESSYGAEGILNRRTVATCEVQGWVAYKFYIGTRSWGEWKRKWKLRSVLAGLLWIRGIQKVYVCCGWDLAKITKKNDGFACKFMREQTDFGIYHETKIRGGGYRGMLIGGFGLWKLLGLRSMRQTGWKSSLFYRWKYKNDGEGWCCWYSKSIGAENGMQNIPCAAIKFYRLSEIHDEVLVTLFSEQKVEGGGG